MPLSSSLLSPLSRYSASSSSLSLPSSPSSLELPSPAAANAAFELCARPTHSVSNVYQPLTKQSMPQTDQ
eukprot:333236-Prorocentrum_minimum.AAC.5